MSRTKNPVVIVIVCMVACATLISACARNDPAPALTPAHTSDAAMQPVADSGDVPEVVVSAPRPVKPIVLSERGPGVRVN